MLPFKHHGHLNAMASMNDAPSHGADLCRQLQLADEYLASYVNSIRFANQQLVSCMTSLSDTNNYIACSFCTKTGKKARMWMSISWWRGMCCTPGRLSSGNRTNATFLDISAEIPSSLKPRKRSTGKWDPPHSTSTVRIATSDWVSSLRCTQNHSCFAFSIGLST